MKFKIIFLWFSIILAEEKHDASEGYQKYNLLGGWARDKIWTIVV